VLRSFRGEKFKSNGSERSKEHLNTPVANRSVTPVLATAGNARRAPRPLRLEKCHSRQVILLKGFYTKYRASNIEQKAANASAHYLRLIGVRDGQPPDNL
jgi:hypothetical protein